MTTSRLKLLSAYYRRLRMKNASETVWALLDPRRLQRHVRNIVAGRVTEATNPYRQTFSRAEEALFCAEMSGCSLAEVDAVFDELDGDRTFIDSLRERYRQMRPDMVEGLDPGRFRVWYALTRLRKPQVVMETGVHDGLSSALILRALERNGHGDLVSIDLPSIDLPTGSPGWLVPDKLRKRWYLHLGDARRLLPDLTERYPRVDIFIHDSDHSREHREFEFRTVWPSVAPSGLMLSDDDEGDLLDKLGGEWLGQRFSVECRLPDSDTAHIGGLRL